MKKACLRPGGHAWRLQECFAYSLCVMRWTSGHTRSVATAHRILTANHHTSRQERAVGPFLCGASHFQCHAVSLMSRAHLQSKLAASFATRCGRAELASARMHPRLPVLRRVRRMGLARSCGTCRPPHHAGGTHPPVPRQSHCASSPLLSSPRYHTCGKRHLAAVGLGPTCAPCSGDTRRSAF